MNKKIVTTASGRRAPARPAAEAPGPRLEAKALKVRLGPDTLRLQAPVTFQAGRLYVLWGPSGSGKSSFVRALLGLGELASPRTAAQGEISLFDGMGIEHLIWSGKAYNPAARGQIAFLPQSEKLGFIDGLSVLENLRLFGNLSPRDARIHADRLSARFHLMSLPTRLAHASGGERMRLSAVRGLLKRDEKEPPPALLIADEPSSGLDAEAARSLARELIEYARKRESVVLVITHDPRVFTGEELPDVTDAPRDGTRILKKLFGAGRPGEEIDEGAEEEEDESEYEPDTARAANRKIVHILECRIGKEFAPMAGEVGRLRIDLGRPRNRLIAETGRRVGEFFGMLGGAVLAPIAFLWGLASLRRPGFVLRRVLADGLNPGTQLFSWLGALLIGGTVAYFIFEQLPRPELVEPLLLEEILQATGHTLVRVVLPLGAAALITGKLGAAQAARLAGGVRGGLLETLALGRWRVEAFGLVPAVLAQMLAMTLATVIACASGVTLAALIYVAGHEGASLGLGLSLMLDGLQNAPKWLEFLIAKTLLSGFIGGTLAAMFGLAPASGEDDAARAVHRTLLWGILGVIAAQCALIVWEFTSYL